jgi:hypothetical protein
MDNESRKFSTPLRYINWCCNYITEKNNSPGFPDLPDLFDVVLDNGLKFENVYIEQDGSVLRLFEQVEPAKLNNGLHYLRSEWMGYLGRNPIANLYTSNCTVILKKGNK